MEWWGMGAERGSGSAALPPWWHVPDAATSSDGAASRWRELRLKSVQAHALQPVLLAGAQRAPQAVSCCVGMHQAALRSHSSAARARSRCGNAPRRHACDRVTRTLDARGSCVHWCLRFATVVAHPSQPASVTNVVPWQTAAEKNVRKLCAVSGTALRRKGPCMPADALGVSRRKFSPTYWLL